jgi:ketosteroid isomerase-like protein
MTANEQVIHQFYTAFQQKNIAEMQAAYAENATFNDPVFSLLDAEQVRAMWQMLLTRSNDLNLSFGDVKEYENNRVTVYWQANYTFTATGRKVRNKVNAQFELADGKIIAHTDAFNFYRWAKQAFGGGGFLLGWTKLFQEKVRQTAMKKLEAFMQKT